MPYRPKSFAGGKGGNLTGRRGDNILDHVAGIEDFQVAQATFEAACKGWPGETITLRQGDRIIEDSRKTGFA